jgi:hypothetical protein
MEDQISLAAAALRKTPPRTGTWCGWLGDYHLRKGDKVLLPDRKIGIVYGAARGKIIVWKERIDPGDWPADVYDECVIRRLKNPAAVALGGCKRGVKERPSTIKALTARQNGKSPVRSGNRPRGRPKHSRE